MHRLRNYLQNDGTPVTYRLRDAEAHSFAKEKRKKKKKKQELGRRMPSLGALSFQKGGEI